jgi:anti-sigma regulatory factor (Ser/Thr protein kinase)/serine/threonine protein phosphatase PrpC
MDIKRDEIQILKIEQEADTGICRRKAASLAKQMGFNDIEIGEISILISEMVSNVIKHGDKNGTLILCRISNEQQQKGLEAWCCDYGKGIGYQDKALMDGYTQTGTLGIGLGAIQRFSDEFEINPPHYGDFIKSYFSENNTFKTCIRSRKWLKTKTIWKGSNKHIVAGAVSRAKPGEDFNGDAYLILHLNEYTSLIAVMDGLGHGREAFIASQLAREKLMLIQDHSPGNCISYLHDTLKGTRGATVGIALIDSKNKKLSYSGIGNIEAGIFTNNKKINLMSYGGIVGHNMRTPRVFQYDFQKGDCLCMFSDGIIARWQNEEINWKEHPQKIAEMILSQYSRINDDASILIICGAK